VGEVVAWESGRFANQTTPLFIRDAAQAERIEYNDYCVNTLGKYAKGETALLRAAAAAAADDAKPSSKLAVAVRGCDSRGINRMLADNQLDREQLYLIGLPCDGMRDKSNGELLIKCQLCTHRNAVESDSFIGAAAEEPAETDRFVNVQRFQDMPAEQRAAYFQANYSKCIRCYACRQACPVCTCTECFVDRESVGWQGKQNNLPENRFYNLTRVFHIADRCVECGECERACPMDLPLMVINRKMIQDLEELFAAPEAGLDSEGKTTLTTYDLGDLEEFM